MLLDVTLNGIQTGVFPFIESQGRILIPAGTAQSLRIRNDANAALDLATIASTRYELNRQLGTIRIDMPASQLTILALGSDLAPAAVALSPETTGIFMNYDMTAREYSGNPRSQTDYSGLAVVQAFAPDFIANSGWAYESSRPDGASTAPVRLDSFITWRPAEQAVAVSAGDALSTPGATARPFRFIGVNAGTDHSAEPGWTSHPIASIAGTAQPASSIDLYVNGVMRGQLPTAGGPFNLALPPGSYTDGTRVVVTDVTGRVVEIPLNAPRFNLDLVQQHMLLWSAGLGLPRFSWGSRSSDYLESTYGYGNLRYGISNQVTLLTHADLGPGLTELEAEIKTSVTARIGLSASIAQSQTSIGHGSYVQAGTIMAAPGKLFITASYGRAFDDFHDAVSWSARAYDLANGNGNPLFSLPRRSSLASQVSWEALEWLTLTSSWQRISYQDSPAVSFTSLTANANIGKGANAYLSATHNYGDANGSSITLGISFLLGATLHGSVSGTQQDGKLSGQAQLIRPLGQERGAYGWQLSESRSDSVTYLNGEARIRTGSGIPAIGYSRFAGQSQTYLNATGATGVVAGHPFLSDPVQGGIIIADVGLPDVPVLLNSVEAARSSRDGRAAIAVGVPGTPQRVEIDDRNLPFTAIAEQTQEIITIRAGSGSIAHFGVRSSATGAIIMLLVNGKAPTAGTQVLTTSGTIPIGKNGRAWIPALDPNAVLTLELPDGRRCSVKTRFDGQGGPDRLIGPLDCRTP